MSEQPLVRVVRGEPTETEVAALVGALMLIGREVPARAPVTAGDGWWRPWVDDELFAAPGVTNVGGTRCRPLAATWSSGSVPAPSPRLDHWWRPKTHVA